MINRGFSMITTCRKGIRYLRYDTEHTPRKRPHHHMINEGAVFMKLIMISYLHKLTGDVDL